MHRLTRLALCLGMAASAGCGTAFVDTSVIDKARREAADNRLSAQERGKILEDAGDSLAGTIRGGFASDMYFEAALEYDVYKSTEGDEDVKRVYQKCVDAGLQREAGCATILTETIEKWEPNRTTPASVRRTASASPVPAPASTNSPSSQIDDAIVQAKAARSGVPATIDGCPTGLDHLADKLPMCRQNSDLLKLRELALLTDASFRADIAAGLTLRQVATTTAQAARKFEEALSSDEQAMLDAAAVDSVARARIKALSEVPARCDAQAWNAFGMQEAAYQAYVASYMAAQVNRAVSAIAACRARAKQ